MKLSDLTIPLFESKSWKTLIDQCMDQDGNLILYHGGPFNLKQFDSAAGDLLVGVYLTPSKNYASVYAKKHGSIYVVKATGKIANLYGNSDIGRKLAKEANKQNVIDLEKANLDTKNLGKASFNDRMNYYKSVNMIKANAYYKTFKRHGYIGRAIPASNEIIIYDSSSLKIIEEIRVKKK